MRLSNAHNILTLRSHRHHCGFCGRRKYVCPPTISFSARKSMNARQPDSRSYCVTLVSESKISNHPDSYFSLFFRHFLENGRKIWTQLVRRSLIVLFRTAMLEWLYVTSQKYSAKTVRPKRDVASCIPLRGDDPLASTNLQLKLALKRFSQGMPLGSNTHAVDLKTR